MEISLKNIKIKKLSGTELIKLDVRDGLFGEPQFTIHYKEKCNYCGYIGNSMKTHIFANTCTISGGSHQCFKCKKSSPFDMHLDASVEFNKIKAKKEEEKKLEEDKKKKEQEQKKIEENRKREEQEQRKLKEDKEREEQEQDDLEDITDMEKINESVIETPNINEIIKEKKNQKKEVKQDNKIVSNKVEEVVVEDANFETISKQPKIQSNITNSPKIQNKKTFTFKIEYFIYIPILNWIPWLNLYFHTKEKDLLKWTLLYIIPFLLGLALRDDKTKHIPDFVNYITLILYIIGIVHFKSLKTEEKK